MGNLKSISFGKATSRNGTKNIRIKPDQQHAVLGLTFNYAKKPDICRDIEVKPTITGKGTDNVNLLALPTNFLTSHSHFSRTLNAVCNALLGLTKPKKATVIPNKNTRIRSVIGFIIVHSLASARFRTSSLACANLSWADS